ncbi:AtaL-like protein [Saccharomonospora saliphila]|uniref:AtaL-like protein n=1 Tax=Saccharomonospora saliphila TaxID=369829 RepID=UPI00036B585E|nr:AtaL-like protein [Saccharomonospora saliphila]
MSVAATPDQWEGCRERLAQKARAPMAYVPAIVGCEVLSEHEDGFLRRIELPDGTRLRERVLVLSGEQFRFDQIDDPDLSAIENLLILSGDTIEFTLRVTLSEQGTERAFGDVEWLRGTHDYFGSTVEPIVTGLAGHQG